MIHRGPMRHRQFLLALILVLASVGASAQANSELTGIVTDQTGAVVAGATVVLSDPATGISKTTESGSTGLYDIGGLNPANYNLKVTANGFGGVRSEWHRHQRFLNLPSQRQAHRRRRVANNYRRSRRPHRPGRLQCSQHCDQLRPDQRNCHRKPQLRSPCRAWPRR